MVDKTLKFAWAYLLTYGKPTNGNWSYYGGNWNSPDGRFSSTTVQNNLKDLNEKVLEIGIDWKKTGIPEVSDKDVFDGTFGDGSTCLGTLGKLVLKNGESFLIGSDDNDAAHLAETARQLMRGKDSVIEDLANKL